MKTIKAEDDKKQRVSYKWVKFENLRIEVNFEQKQNGKMFKDIKIPEGQRLLRIEELGEVISYILENKLEIWSFFEQPIKFFQGKYVARFAANSDWVNLSCSRQPQYSGASLGVIFCRDVKK